MSLFAAVFCIILAYISVATSEEKCKKPAGPSHGRLKLREPNITVYNDGDKAEVICDSYYFLSPKPGSGQTCRNGTWSGEPSVCLPNLVGGQDLAHFGSRGRQAEFHSGSGSMTFSMTNSSEKVYASIYFPEKINHSYISLRGNFTLTDKNLKLLTFSVSLLACNENLDYRENCSKLASADYFECTARSGKSFTAAKVEISIQEKINLTNNSVTVKFEMEDNGFVVLSHSETEFPNRRVSKSASCPQNWTAHVQNSGTQTETSGTPKEPPSDNSFVKKYLMYICIAIGCIFMLLLIGLCCYCKTRNANHILLADLTADAEATDSSTVTFTIRCRPPVSPIPGSYPLVLKDEQPARRTDSDFFDDCDETWPSQSNDRMAPVAVPGSFAGPSAGTLMKPYVNLRPPNRLRPVPAVPQFGRNNDQAGCRQLSPKLTNYRALNNIVNTNK